LKVINQIINLENQKITLTIKREDLIHPFVSGNKFRKLKYNLLQAKTENQSTILTFGGAFSNHLAAVAYAGKENDFQTIGIIRGEELENKISKNPTLQFAQNCGMKLQFVSREAYRLKTETAFLENLKLKYNDFYLIPEGGTNDLAIQGCQEILTTDDDHFDYICCAVGTGGTISGIINSSKNHQKIIGFPALKGDFLENEIRKFAKNNSNWELNYDYHFGGYAKVNSDLIAFINQFYKKHKVLLDPIYTGKMVFGVMDLINKDYFPKMSKILIIHTGGIQGIEGINTILKQKNQEIIITNV
jgi:1-aminocyclopropane-1-carboxylate deaminase